MFTSPTDVHHPSPYLTAVTTWPLIGEWNLVKLTSPPVMGPGITARAGITDCWTTSHPAIQPAIQPSSQPASQPASPQPGASQSAPLRVATAAVSLSPHSLHVLTPLTVGMLSGCLSVSHGTRAADQLGIAVRW